jgi:hypothetical protein
MRGRLLGARCGLEVALLVALLAWGWGCGGGGGGGGPKDVLQQLGVTEDQQPRTDSDSLQPLRRKHFVYRPDSQLYLSGMTTYTGYFTATGKHQVLADGEPGSWGALFWTDDEDWYTYDSTSTAADLRGEGQQEAVVFYRNASASPPTGFLRVTGRDVTTGLYSEKGPYQILGVDLAFGKPLGDYWNDLQLAAGDLDADGADELVLAAGKTVLVLKYDALSDRFTIVDQIVYRPDLNIDQLTTVAVGDVDQDGRPEVVVVNGAYDPARHASFYVYNLTGGALVEKEMGALSEASDGGGRDYGFARVAIGDLDGDNVNELAFGGDVFDNQLAVTVYKYDAASATHQPLTTHEYGINWGLQWMPAVAVFKPDGDPAHNALLAYTNILKLDGGKLAYKFDPNVLLADPFGDRVTVGDFTDDGRDDVAFFDSGGYLEIWAYDVQTRAIGRTHIWPFWVRASTTLTAVNADRDSLVLEYKSYEFAYSYPRVVAVLVSPPVYRGQDGTGCGGTTIEWEAGAEVDATTTHGFYAGLSLGFEAEAPLWGSAASEEFKLNVDTSMDWNFTTGSTQSVARPFSTGSGEDQVVFVSVPYDIYHYTVVSSPDGKAGYDLAIQVPRKPVIQRWDLDLFNSIVADGYKVPDEAFNPATGKRHGQYVPSSYPTHAEMASILPVTANGTATDPATGNTYTRLVPSNGSLGGFRTPDELIFGVGVADTGCSGISLANGTSSGYGTEFNLQVGFEAQEVAGGVLVGERAGYHYGYSGSYNTTGQTTVSGSVPSIPISMKDTVQPYSVGLFAYPYPNDAAAQYIVVNYWVE